MLPTSLNLSFSRREVLELINRFDGKVKGRTMINASFSLWKEASAELDSVKTEEVGRLDQLPCIQE
jgi:hypothetical protein